MPVPASFDAPPGRVLVGLSEQYTATYSADSSVPTTLGSFSIGPNRIYVPGDSIVFEFFGNLAGVAGSTSQILLKFGALGVFDTGLFKPLAGAGGTGWIARGRLVRIADGSLEGFVVFQCADLVSYQYAAVTPDLSAGNTLDVIGVGLTANDVSLAIGIVDFRGCRV